MKKALLILPALFTLMILIVSLAIAQNENAALVVRLDDGCDWDFNGIEAEGSVHYVETSNGKWTLSCEGFITSEFPEQAVQLTSTADDPLGPCFTPFGSTFDWHVSFSPSGESTFTCHGDLTPTEPGENGAFIVKLDEDCEWDFGGIVAEGGFHYAENSTGKWTLSCHGDIVSGTPDSAVQFKSTADDPVGVCFTPFDTTLDWQVTFSPSGKSSFVCQGELDPY